jgi:hypothetical protein
MDHEKRLKLIIWMTALVILLTWLMAKVLELRIRR